MITTSHPQLIAYIPPLAEQSEIPSYDTIIDKAN